MVRIFRPKDPTGNQAEEDDPANGDRLGEDVQIGGPIGRSGDDLRFHADDAQVSGQLRIFDDEHEKAAGERGEHEGECGEQGHLGTAGLERSTEMACLRLIMVYVS